MQRNRILRLWAAALCGTVVGFGRGYRVKSADYRTRFPMASGSALNGGRLAVRLRRLLATHGGVRFVPSRTAAQVMNGIGAIGAGAIIHRKLARGLTRAVSRRVTAGIGLAFGAGRRLVTGASTLPALFGPAVPSLFSGRAAAVRCPAACARALALSSLCSRGAVRGRKGGLLRCIARPGLRRGEPQGGAVPTCCAALPALGCGTHRPTKELITELFNPIKNDL